MTIETTRDAMPVDERTLAALQSRMRGHVLRPGDTEYNTIRRLVNSRYDCHPALIARCQNAEDVVQAIAFAREHNVEIAVRSGGHSSAGHGVGDGVMMIDLSAMRGIELDSIRRVARVEPGATTGECVQAFAPYDLALPTGTCATVGMGGATLGGGIGWLTGRFGMTIDNVLAFELVTADGQVVVASADANTDLFWALRGGGGNFGVVTAVYYQLHELETVLGGMLMFPLAAAPLALHAYREITSSAPDELAIYAVMTTVPNFGPALIVQSCYSGANVAEGERVLAPLHACGPAITAIAPHSYAELFTMLTPPILPGAGYYDVAYTVRQLSDAALDAIITSANDRPSPFSLINIHHFHGAATRVHADSTAFALREPHYAVVNIGMWLKGASGAETAWAQQTRSRMAPFSSRGVYVNFLSDEGDEGVRDSYSTNYDRLVAIKTRYDRDNVFHRNHNIRPTPIA